MSDSIPPPGPTVASAGSGAWAAVQVSGFGVTPKMDPGQCVSQPVTAAAATTTATAAVSTTGREAAIRFPRPPGPDPGGSVLARSSKPASISRRFLPADG